MTSRTVTSLLLVLLVSACSETEFGGGTSNNAAAPAEPEIVPVEDPPQSDDCLDGDSINIKFPAEIESCHNEGNLYNFDTKKCTKVTSAEFTCDWDTLVDEMTKIGTSSEKVKSGKAKGNKLVGCGQSKGGDVIVAQWWDAERSDAANCEYGKGKMTITTGCYGDLPTVNEDGLSGKEIQDKIVASCLENLSE